MSRAATTMSLVCASALGTPCLGQQWWWPPTGGMEVTPPCVQAGTQPQIRLSGQWPDNCVPNTGEVVRTGTDLDVNIRREPPPGFCLQVISNWSLGMSTEPLPAGDYSVYATYYRDGAPYTQRVLMGTLRVVAVCDPPACYANCDGSTAAPVLNVADFTCFLQRFAAGDAYANCDGSTAPPALNVADFTCFLQKFAAGCP